MADQDRDNSPERPKTIGQLKERKKKIEDKLRKIEDKLEKFEAKKPKWRLNCSDKPVGPGGWDFSQDFAGRDEAELKLIKLKSHNWSYNNGIWKVRYATMFIENIDNE